MEKNIQTKAEAREQQKKGFFASAKLRLFAMCMALASLMILSAFAADETETAASTTATISSLIADAGTSLPSLMTLVWSLMTANPLISLAVIAAIVTIGIGLLRRLRRVAH